MTTGLKVNGFWSNRQELWERISCIDYDPIVRLEQEDKLESSEFSAFFTGVSSHLASLIGAKISFLNSIFLGAFGLTLITDADDSDAQDSLSETLSLSSI